MGEFAPLLVVPNFRVSCPVLHLALLSENDVSRIVTSVQIPCDARSWNWLLMCPKADKGASLGRGYLNVGFFVGRSNLYTRGNGATVRAKVVKNHGNGKYDIQFQQDGNDVEWTAIPESKVRMVSCSSNKMNHKGMAVQSTTPQGNECAPQDPCGLPPPPPFSSHKRGLTGAPAGGMWRPIGNSHFSGSMSSEWGTTHRQPAHGGACFQ